MQHLKPNHLKIQLPQEFTDEVKNYTDSSELDKVNHDYYLSLVTERYNLTGKEAEEKLEELNSTSGGAGRWSEIKVPIPTLEFKLWYFHEEENETELLISNIIHKEYIKANNTYNFELDYNHMVCQVLKYKSEDRGHFKWHADGHFNFWDQKDKEHSGGLRKLSIGVCIQPPEEGGELRLQSGWDVLETDSTIKTLSLPFETIPQEAGSGVVFPSYYNHSVAPVTKGDRYVLISWAFGPEWK